MVKSLLAFMKKVAGDCFETNRHELWLQAVASPNHACKNTT